MALQRWPSVAAWTRSLIILVLLAGCSGGDSPSASSSNSPPGTGPGGGPTGQPGRFNDRVTAIIPAPDGSGDIYVAGLFTTYNAQAVSPLVRIRPNGTLNETFTLRLNIIRANSQYVLAVAPVDDGSGDIYVAVQDVPADTIRVWKLNPDGSIDASFPPGEVIFTERNSLEIPYIYTIVSVGDGTGRAFICGRFDRYSGVAVKHIVRVTPAGTLDPTFQSAATHTTTVVPADDGTGDLYVINRRICGPSCEGPNTVYRLNADGSVDSGFTPLMAGTIQFEGTINAVLPVGDGSGDIFVGGNTIFLGTGVPAPTVNPDGFVTLARLNPDGSFDLTSPKPAFNQSVDHLKRAVDGTRDILIANFATVMRFKADTTIDPTFIVGRVMEGFFIPVLLPLTDGSHDFYVGGDVTNYNDVPVGRIVRLNANGTLN